MIYPSAAFAQSLFSQGVDECGGSPNCIQRYICPDGCGYCTMEGVKYTEGSTTGKCNVDID